MTRLNLRMLPIAALLFGLSAAPVLASKVDSGGQGVLKVDDEAGLFSAAGIAKAKSDFDGTTFRARTHMTVRTVSDIPNSKKADFDAVAKDPAQRGKFFESWARELAKADGNSPDVFVLIFTDGKKFFPRVISDRESDSGRGFTDTKAGDVARVFQNALEPAVKNHLTGEALHAKLDAALADATHLVITDLKNKDAVHTNHVNTAHGDNNGGGRGIMGYVCIGIAALLGVWLVIGLIRAFTGGGGGGYGGGGYGGGGGGGFMSSMLGGMFGAAAGMYLYDQFSGHNHSNDLGASNSYDNGGTTDTGDGDYDNGASAGDGGGDWGDSGGGDAGGGDWGGGDAGGGDFGGGDW